MREYIPCEKCGSMVHNEYAKPVWTSIHDCEGWCDNCSKSHTLPHPIHTDERWAIGSTDNENNLTIK